MRFEITDVKKGSTPEALRTRKRDFAKHQPQEPKKLFLPESNNGAVSQKLEDIRPSMLSTYKWVVLQDNPSLLGKDLEKAVQKLHKDRQEKNSNPNKTVVAPDESGAQTLVGQSFYSEGQGGERLKEKLREDIRKNLRKNLRSIAKEYRQEGKIRSTAPIFLEDMSEGQIMLEVMRNSDWLDRLQKKGIKANKQAFESMHETLNARLESHIPLDYNTAPAIKNFKETSDKLGFAALELPPLGLEGGIYYNYDTHTEKYTGRIMTLRDPKGKKHTFNKGQQDEEIASYTTQCIEKYKDEYTQLWINDCQRRGYSPRLQQIRKYKDQHGEGSALTERDIELMKKGENIKGWTCIDLKYFDIPKTSWYTDQGEEIHALKTSRYKPISIAEVLEYLPLNPIEGGEPTPAFNCHSYVHLKKPLWLVPEKFGEKRESYSQIQRILLHNGYHRIAKRNAKRGDPVFYWRKGNNYPPHEAVVISNINGKITVRAKVGHGVTGQHDIDDPFVKEKSGKPFVFHSDRRDEKGRKSNLLRRNPPSRESIQRRRKRVVGDSGRVMWYDLR